jgi:hypothetical protein
VGPHDRIPSHNAPPAIVSELFLSIGRWSTVFLFFSCNEFLSDQAMFLYFMKKSAKNGHFSFLENTFQGQKQGCKDFKIP